MTRVSHLWTLCSLLLLVETSLCVHFIREKGTKTTIGCRFPTSEPNTMWQVRSGHDFINVTSCTFGQNICVDRMPQQFYGEVENREGGFLSRLYITNVRINITEFRCLSGYSSCTFTLEVYARPSKPLCDPVELDYTKKNLQFRCRTTNVFPSVRAIFNILGVNLSHADVLSGHCSNEESDSPTMDGFSAECVMRLSVAKLEPLKYKYYVNMFPDLTDSTGIKDANVFSQDYTLQLSSPRAAIDVTRCPLGPGVVGDKIINGTTASCRCVLDSPGFPVGQARWYTEHGVQSLGRDDTTDGSSTLVIYSNTTGKSFQCRAESRLRNSQNRGPVYTPVFTILLSDPVCDPVELDYTKKDLQFTCRAINVYPYIRAILYIKRVNVLQEGVLSTHCSNEKPGSRTLGGHTTECTWIISAATMEPLKYKYFVKMFPNLSNSTGISVPNVISQEHTLQLSSPQAAIDVTRCPVGPGVVGDKIINGTTASCRCVLESPGFPVGQARWYTEQGNQSLGRDDTTDGSSTLVIYSNTTGQSFQCRAESLLKNSHNRGPVYTPVFTILLSDPVCDPVELDYSKEDLQFICRAINDYPSLRAILYLKRVNVLQEGVLSTNCSNDKPGSLTLGGHSTECTWSISAANLEPVKYTYYVKMFPNMSNSTVSNVLRNVISQNHTLELSSPVAVIDIKSCPIGFGVVDGKILTGLTASCRCVLESPGFPTGQARWYTLHGNESLGIDNIADGSSTLEIYNNTTGQSYRCRAESPLKNSLNWGPVYAPVFTTPSSGPETYSLRIEIVAGILAGFVVLTVVIAIVIWKWRGRKQQNYETRVVYNRPSEDAQSDSGKPECSGNYNTLSF